MAQVVRDPVLLAFVFLSLIVGMVYAQGEVTLPLAMIADGLTPADYGLALAVNGALIVLVTLHAVRWIERAPRFAVLALSAVLTGIGFGLTQFATALPFYALTVVIWTLGEILAAAIGPTLVAELAPTTLRGLYQGVFGASWGLAFFLGPALGGYLYAIHGPAVLWGACLVACLGVAVGYLFLAVPARRRLARQPAPLEPA